MAELGGWAAKLNDVVLVSSCDGTFLECPDGEATILDGLTTTPDGITGTPGVRTEDVVYAQRDGMRPFNDWYINRLVTLQGVIGPITDEDCESGCLTAREQVQELVQAWKRSDTVELVLYPPCYPGPYGFGLGPFGEGPFGGAGESRRDLEGPYGIRGRPRIQPNSFRWLDHTEQICEFTLLFVALDQKIFILDACGTPGYEKCTVVEPGATFGVVCEPLCSPICATEDSSGSVEPTVIEVGGTEVVYPTITLWPDLHHPIVENMTTLDYFTYNGDVTDYPVIINTEDMTATQNGESMTHLLGGSLKFPLSPGEFEIRVLTRSRHDEGYMTICTRDTLVSI